MRVLKRGEANTQLFKRREKSGVGVGVKYNVTSDNAVIVLLFFAEGQFANKAGHCSAVCCLSYVLVGHGKLLLNFERLRCSKSTFLPQREKSNLAN